MTTHSKSTKGEPSFMLRVKCQVVSKLVPSYLRRAILVCSLAAVLLKDKSDEYEKIAKTMKEELSLDYAYGHAAMLSPMQWGSRIWRGLPPIDLENNCRGKGLAQTAQCVFDNIPRSLVYGNNRVMLDDIFATIRAIGKFKVAPQTLATA